MIDTFPNRRDRLFGRDSDIRFLSDRSMRTGVTAIAARPLMGKTWCLHELARRLLENGTHVVGYHESKAAESSHLLYAVSNLYARWLADSTMREQAISLWKRHKKDLVPRVGMFVGELLEDIAKKQMPEGIASMVRSAFDRLADAQQDLLTGGMNIAALPYDQALSLVSLVSKISNRRIALILDAWEKSPSIRSEVTTLEAILKHQDEWTHTHVFLGVRNPDLDSTKLDNEAYLKARDLSRISRAATIYELPPMNLQGDAKESGRIIQYLHENVPAAEYLSDQSILEMIDGYPGVLNFWTSEVNRVSMHSEEDLQTEASNAHALRYLELDQLLGGLDGIQRVLAARFAFFPRLDAEGWMLFRAVLLKDGSDVAIDQLIDNKVLHDSRFPTYGHDTRHTFARLWFVENERPLMRRVAETIIRGLASQITGINVTSRPYYEALAACSDTAHKVDASLTTLCLTDAARAAFGNKELLNDSEFDGAYPIAIQEERATIPIVAAHLVNRGVNKGRHGDNNGAIDDYTAAIDLAFANGPVEIVAQGLFNRGVKKERLGDFRGAFGDYSAVIDLANAPDNLVKIAINNRYGLHISGIGQQTGPSEPIKTDLRRKHFLGLRRKTPYDWHTTIIQTYTTTLKDLCVAQSHKPETVREKISTEKYEIKLTSTNDRPVWSTLLVEKTHMWHVHEADDEIQDPCKLALLIYRHDSDNLCGSLTLGLDSSLGLASDKLYKEDADLLRSTNRRVCEIATLSMSQENVGKDIFAALLHLFFIYSHKIYRATDVLMLVEPHHAKFFCRSLGFEPFGSEKLLTTIEIGQPKQIPVQLLRLELSHMNNQIDRYGGTRGQINDDKTLYPYFLAKLEEEKITSRLIGGEQPA